MVGGNEILDLISSFVLNLSKRIQMKREHLEELNLMLKKNSKQIDKLSSAYENYHTSRYIYVYIYIYAAGQLTLTNYNEAEADHIE